MQTIEVISALKECNCLGRYKPDGLWLAFIKEGDDFSDPKGLKVFEPSEWKDATSKEIEDYYKQEGIAFISSDGW